MTDALMADPVEIVGELGMHKAAGFIAIVIEGISDQRVLAGLVRLDRVVIIVAGNKSTALDVVSEVERSCRGGDVDVCDSIVLIDRDNDELTGHRGMVIRTAARDLDSEIAAIDTVLKHAVRSMHDCLTDEEVEGHVMKMMYGANVLQSIRDVGRTCRIGLNVDGVRGHLGNRLYEADVEELCDAVLCVNSGSMAREELVAELSRELAKARVISDMRGHDLHVLLSSGIAGGKDQVQRFFRAALRLEDFLCTPTGKALNAWGRKAAGGFWR